MNGSKTLLRTMLLIVFLLGLTFSWVLFMHRTPVSTPAMLIESSPVISTSEGTPYGLPVRLTIPVINVNSAIEYVGLTSDGAMDIPKNRNDVAWFELGQRPGEIGSSVIAGHYGWKDGKASAFDNLHRLRPGDRLYIEDDQGVATSFVVREMRRYDSEAEASEVFGSHDGKSHLNLITCEGAWDKSTEEYSQRLVVFTDKE